MANFKANFDNLPESEVYKLPALTPQICKFFLNEVTSIKKQFPNVELNYKGVILNQFGFDSYFEQMASYLSPLLCKLYPSCSVPPFEMQFVSAIVVHYDANDKNMSKGHFEHADDSDLTLNIVLNPHTSFSGGELSIKLLGKYRSTETGYTVVPHEHGCGILHRGKAAHSSWNMDKGSRYNLVIWFKAVPLSFYDQVVPFKQEVPQDVKTVIAGYMDPLSLYRFMQSSKQHLQIANDAKIWFNIYNKLRIAHSEEVESFDANTNWKSRFKTKDFLQPPLVFMTKAVRDFIFSTNNCW